jgi:hypothetical protein
MADPVNDIVEEIPFAELVRKSALAIADGQTALDLNSVQTAQTLADMEIDAGKVVLALLEETDADGNVTNVTPVTNDQPLSLLAYGVTPTFYEFSETEIDLKFWVRWYTRSRHVESDSQFTRDLRTEWESSRKKYGGGGGVGLNLGFFSIGGRGGYQKSEVKGEREVELSVKTHSEYDSKVYGLDASAACRLRTTLTPKPAPDRAVPEIVRQQSAGGSS